MTRAGIVAQVYEKLGLTKQECYDIVGKFFEVIKETLAKDENVKISGLGKFIVKQKYAKKGKNFYTGEEVEIARRKVLIFKLSGVLKNKINE